MVLYWGELVQGPAQNTKASAGRGRGHLMLELHRDCRGMMLVYKLRRTGFSNLLQFVGVSETILCNPKP